MTTDHFHAGTLAINAHTAIPMHEIEMHATHAQGHGGQNVNKVATAIHLRFDIQGSSLSAYCKQRLLALNDQRITRDGVVVIKAQQFRTQEKNRQDALDRLAALVRSALVVRRPRIATRPGAAAKRKRLDRKTKRGQTKSLRRTPDIN